MKQYQTLSGVLLFSFLFSTADGLETSQAAPGLSDGLSISVGLEFDSGDYGTADTTDTWRVPLGLEYRKGQYFAGLSIPYIHSQSTGTVTVSGGRNPGGRSRMTTTTATSTAISETSGLGDLELYAGYHLLPAIDSNIRYHVSARVKLGTADKNKGLGTGENDYAIEAGLFSKQTGSQVFASIGYQVNGDRPNVDYNNVLYTNIGISFPWPVGYQLGVMLDYAQAAIEASDDSLEATAFMSTRLSSGNTLYLYILAGFTDNSPDYGAGINYRIDY